MLEFKNEINNGRYIYQYGKIIGKEMLGGTDIVKTYKVLVVYDVISYINKKDYSSDVLELTYNQLPEEFKLQENKNP